MNYEYTIGNRFSEKMVYMYSSFNGVEFIDSFLKCRQNYLDHCDHSCIPLSNVIDNLKEFVGKHKWYIEPCSVAGCTEIFQSGYEFTKLFNNLSNPIIKVEDKALITKFIRKFEITQKIYEFYPLSLGPGYGRMDIIPVYLMLGCCLLLNYMQNNDLQSLSTLMKLNDKLIAVSSNTPFSEAEKYCLSIIVSAETGIVKDWRSDC